MAIFSHGHASAIATIDIGVTNDDYCVVNNHKVDLIRDLRYRNIAISDPMKAGPTMTSSPYATGCPSASESAAINK